MASTRFAVALLMGMACAPAHAQPPTGCSTALDCLKALAIPSKEKRAVAISEALEKQLLLWDVARLGPEGRDLGPLIERYLFSSDEPVRVAAARTLGYIGHRESVPSLIVALNNPSDCLLSGAAALSLGRMQAVEARGALQGTAERHWYPPVRVAAAEALRSLSGDRRSVAEDPNDRGAVFRFSPYFPDRWRRDVGTCATDAAFPRSRTESGLLSEGLAKQLAYRRELVYSVESGEKSHKFEATPIVGLRVAEGWVLGGNRGEFGGELMFKPDGGATRLLVEDNIGGIYRFRNGRLVAIAGLSHLGSDHGRVYEITCNRATGCAARWWRQLPADPRDSWILQSGELLVNTSAGSIVIDQDGGMKLASCHDRRGPKSLRPE